MLEEIERVWGGESRILESLSVSAYSQLMRSHGQQRCEGVSCVLLDVDLDLDLIVDLDVHLNVNLLPIWV